MLLLRKPDPDTMRRFVNSQSECELTYPGVGKSINQAPRGYVVDHTRTRLGIGEHIFAAAKSALESWQQFQLGWLSAWPATTPIREGEVVAIVAHSCGMWWLNACRIVYTIDARLEQLRFGFAYGTLPAHAGAGEERFLIEMDEDGIVRFDILAFSRPQHPLAFVGYPYVRWMQKRFCRQASEAMRKAVNAQLQCGTARSDPILRMSGASSPFGRG